MANYLSAIKTKFLIFGLDVACFSDHCLRYYQKAEQMNSPLNVKLKSIIDISLLKRIVYQCDFTYMGQIFKALYLRLSNLVPHAVAQFSPLKHLARGDVILRPEKIVVILKWSKTMQTNNQIKFPTLASVLLLPSRTC